MKILILFTSILLTSFGHGSIHEITSFSQAHDYLKDLDSNSLVILDVDGVISIPRNPCLRLCSFAKHMDLISPWTNSLSVEENDYFIGLQAIDSGDQLVDESLPIIIEQMQSDFVKVIALTAIPSGKIDRVENMTLWRQKQLLNHGIDLSSSFTETKQLFFCEFPENLNSYPSFYKGVITANGIGVTSKGDVLISFLNRMQFLPEKVIFFDDHLNHLESVEKSLSAASPGTNFVGFLYQGAHLIDSPVSPGDFSDKIKELVLKAKESQGV